MSATDFINGDGLCAGTRLRILLALLLRSPQFAAEFDKRYDRAKIDVVLAKHDTCEICK